MVTETLVISSGGLSPSNRDAGFPNLARRKSGADFSVGDIAECTAICEAELQAAGIKVTIFPSPLGGEVR